MTSPAALLAAPYEPLLLRAATAAPADAVAAWTTFLDAHRLDEVGDAEAQRLLAGVHHRLTAAGAPAATPELARLVGVRRRTWVLNQQAAADLVAAVDLLDKAGIEAVVAPFTASCLSGDIDRVEVGVPALLVTPCDARRARHVLGVRHVLGARSQSVSVGYWPSPWMRDIRDPNPAWTLITQGATTSTIARREVSVLDPTTALVAVATTGLVPGSAIRLRWAVAATHLVTDADHQDGSARSRIDRDRLVELADHFAIGPVVADVLTWLAHDLGVPVDPALVEGLARFETQRDACARVGRRRSGPFPQLRSDWAFARRRLGPAEAVAAIPTFLVERWALTSPRQIPAEVAARARQRVGLATAATATARSKAKVP